MHCVHLQKGTVQRELWLEICVVLCFGGGGLSYLPGSCSRLQLLILARQLQCSCLKKLRLSGRVFLEAGVRVVWTAWIA